MYGYSEENKRASPRFLFSEPVAYGKPEVSFSGALAENISLGGIAIKIQGFVPVGTMLELQIHLDQSPKVMWVKAEVVRVKELSEDCFEIGLRFINDEESIKAVTKYIEGLLT